MSIKIVQVVKDRPKKGFIEFFISKAIGFHRQAKLLELNFFNYDKNFPPNGQNRQAKLSIRQSISLVPGAKSVICS